MTWIIAEDPYEVKVERRVDIDVVWHLIEDGDFELSSDKEVEDAENKAIDEYWDCMKDKSEL
jgi:hypothetical protein